MDSLLANYASSDDDDEQHNNQPSPPPQHSNSAESLQPQKPPSSSSLFSSLPKPQSASSLFSSLPPPKSHPSSTQFTPKSTPSSTPTSQNHGQTGGEEKGLHRDPNSGSSVSSGLFSSLPAPKSQPDSGPIPTSSQPSSVSKKRVVQFRPPVIQSSFKSDDKDDEDDDDDDEYLDKKQPQVIDPNSSFKSFISSMPAPMNSATLGMSGTGGSGRRAIVETSVSSLSSDVYNPEKEVETGSIARSVQESSNNGSISGSLGAVEGQLGAGPDVANWEQPGESYVGYESYESYANYEGYASYGNEGHYDQNNWANAPSTWVAPEASVPGLVETVVRGSGKRRRDQIPTEIVEVNQDELMKNRPRQDQSKLTGIAFGPAYQPAPSGGGSGKPTKLHKRKHQIGSLYFDMKQKEMELSERRAKGMLTKAETQAKYGW